MYRDAGKHLFDAARSYRSNPTRAEYKLWLYLRTKPFGIKFRRQHPFLLYVLDFYANSLKLVIELDGSIHENEEVKRKDMERQRILESNGLKVIRFNNNEVIDDIQGVINKINKTVEGLKIPFKEENEQARKSNLPFRGWG